MGFDGRFPDPLIEAEVGETIRARLTNSLSAADHDPLARPAGSGVDGRNREVQTAVQPGEIFDYRFTLPDAGTFWYHPHANETVQLERGLYGALVVRGPERADVRRRPRAGARRREARPDDGYIADDALIRAAQRAAKASVACDQRSARARARDRGGSDRALADRERVRARATCASRSAAGPSAIIGSDGGLSRAPVTATEILVTPGERVELAVGPFADEARCSRSSRCPIDRGMRRPAARAVRDAARRAGAAVAASHAA